MANTLVKPATIRRPRFSARRWRRDACFLVLLAAGTGLRALTVAGYRPALWFNDSYDYVRIGLEPFPHPLRPEGYGLMLWALEPLHSFAAVTTVQHLLILGLAIAAYRLMVRRFGVGRRWAAAATAPVLLDPYQIQLEHMVLSDTLFTALVFGAVWALVRTSPRWAAVAGVLLGAAAVTRTVGLPLVAVAGLYLVIRHGPRRAAAASAALLAGFALPVGATMAWHHSATGRLELAGSGGVYLWGRTAAFADCTAHPPPEGLARMCPRERPGRRSASSTQIWEADSPTGWRHGRPFPAETDADARRFALWAIANQPTDYAGTVLHDLFVRSFSWSRTGYPHPWTVSFYEFPSTSRPHPDFPLIGGGTSTGAARRYEHAPAGTRVAEPYAAPLRWYQRNVRMPGTVLGLTVAVGAAGLLRRRGTSAEAALLWTTGFALLAVPPLTTDFDYRYLQPAVPLLCMAAVTVWRTRDRGAE
ncbi:hypothetical protein ACFHW2_01985 [Actinomadura sp. LOL_016]|uniref:hypothetical protein n=1 Tax=unclassified Actinomadura TaxID=2626254 RepID=UPI003A7FB0E7